MQNGNLKFKIIFIVFLIFSSFYFININLANAYDDQTTHPALTDEIVDFYNLSFPDKKLTPQQKEWIIEGSILEDTPPRWINHFYDPINKTGWSGEHTGKYDAETVQIVSKNLIAPYGIAPVSSLNWLHNEQLQAQYKFYQGAKTWEQGILEMIKGNEEESYKILGYILHLIEDATVPEHTRNDTHAHELEKATEDYGSPYEEYLKKYNRTTIKENLNLAVNFKNQGLSPIQKNSIDEYLISLAEYSNKYFFSKDTINDPKYQFPKIIRDDGNFGYGKDENGKEFPLTKIKIQRDDNNEFQKVYLLARNESEYYPILDAYFTRLSRQAVLNGAGVIDLFHKEIELKKEYSPHSIVYDFSPFNYFRIPRISLTGELAKIKNAAVSFFAQTISLTKNTVSSVSNFFSGASGDDNRFQPAGQISLDQTDNQTDEQKSENESEDVQPTPNKSRFQLDYMGQAKQTDSEQQPKDENQNQNKNQTQASNQKTSENKNVQSPQIIKEDEEKNDKQEDSQKQPPKNQLTEQQPQQSKRVAQKECSFNTSRSPSRQKVIINEVAWMGTTNSANDEWIELKNISGGEVDLTGWQLIDQNEQIKINFNFMNKTKIPAGGFILLERTNDDSVPYITADLIYTGALSNSNEGLRLFDNQCNLIDEVLTNPAWPAGDSAQKRTMERDGSAGLTTSFSWHTYNGAAYNNISGTPKAENSASTVTITSNSSGSATPSNSNENNTSSNSLSNNQSPTQYQKILINEIQLSPTSNRFIELYNLNDSAVDLTNWYIQRKTQGGDTFTSLVSKTYFENKTITAYGYFLISRESLEGADIVLNGLTLTESNTIQLKNPNAEVADKVGWGEANDCEGACASNPTDGQSIQRKFQNNIFVDTNNNADDFETQACPSPKAQSNTCQISEENNQSNEAPGAFFVNHILISEIMAGAGTGHSDEEFIELYNPNNNQIDLTGYSLKRRPSANSTSTQTLVKADDFQNKIIPAKGFILIASPEYQASSSSPDIIYSHSYRLSDNDDVITLYNNNDEIIDEINYSNIEAGQSLERKALSDNQCVSSQLDGEFLGNGCDTAQTGADYTQTSADFEIRNNPNPQNSQSLPEPRNAPTTPQNFTIQYNSNTMNLNLRWDASQDYSGATSSITYKITDTSNSSSTFSDIETSATSTSFSINEIGRDYQFSLQAFDKDGFGSASATSTTSVPSFLVGLYFYQDPRDSSADYLIDAYYNQYPFIPDLYRGSANDNWKLLVFYLNSDAQKQFNIDNQPYQPDDLENVLAVKYKHCSGGSVIAKNSLLLPDISQNCGTEGGANNISFSYSELEDNHFIIQVASSTSELALNYQDYLTLAFYSPYSFGGPYFQLIAVDKTKYYFGNQPNRQPPQLTGSINFSFDKPNSRLDIDWPKAADSDTLDSLLTYEIQYASSTEWLSVGTATATTKFVSPGDNLSISVRTKDDFGNYSNYLSEIQWSYPETVFYITQTEANASSSIPFGKKDGTQKEFVALQSITATTTLNINRVVLKIQHAVKNNTANLRLAIYEDDGSNHPNPGQKLGEAIMTNVFGTDGNQDMTFGFNNPISLNAGTKYWLVLGVENYLGGGGWDGNDWRVIESNANPYAFGEAWSARLQNDAFSDFTTENNADWYMKIGLE